jgi:hypothetical protein
MVIHMNETKLATLEQIREFLAGTSDVAFATPADEPRLRAFVASVLRRFRYFSRPKGQRGVLFEYMQRLSGYSRQHLSRLIAQFRDTHSIEPITRASRTSFSRKYQAEDVVLLAQTDNLHDTLSGPTTQVLLRRAFSTFGDLRYERLSQISVSHLYNLRTSAPYLKHRLVWRKTRPSPIPIGIRKAPAPHGLPGYIRIDTVHQGDQDGVKGVYHINAVDIVTQWELVAAVEHISEAFLLPVIALLLEGFPFAILGFHSDGGSEFINHEIAGLLEKLRVEFTRSRPRHTNDNALAESKNGAVIRKIMGYTHIPQKHAAVINQFYSQTLNPYLNFHRPCYFALDAIDAKGKIKKTYPHELIKTPFQRLQSVKDYALYLKPGITPKGLEHQAAAMSDNEAAKQVQQARRLLFQSINRRSKSAA